MAIVLDVHGNGHYIQPILSDQFTAEHGHFNVTYEQYMEWYSHNFASPATPSPTITGTTTTAAAINGILDDLMFNSNATAKAQSSKPKDTLRMDEIISYSRMNFDSTRSKKYEKEHSIKGPEFVWATQDAIVGIEVEVENIREAVPIEAFWTHHIDNSLRNNGIEFVSAPMNIKRVQIALQHLYEAMEHNNKPDFSNRTSIHVHLNCRDLTQKQIKALVLLYCIFERHFYAFVGTRRLSSIFCVPVYRTNILSALNDCIDGPSLSWHKYCGINLLPLMSGGSNGNGYGTIEFRHLYGTNDTTVIMNWINNIICLRKAALEIPYDDLIAMIKEMNTNSSYQSLYHQVFEGIPKLLDRKIDFEECVSNVKRELFGNEYSKTIQRSSECDYWSFINANGLVG